MIKTVN